MSWFGKTALGSTRWVVVDCETSGLDTARDRLLSIGACVLSGHRIHAAECFSAVLQQLRPSEPHNILVHGLGADAQLGGRPEGEVLAEFACFVGEGRPAAFHAPFDAAILRRAFIGANAAPLRKTWLDLAQIAPALFPERARTRRTLDEWLQEFGIPSHSRHDALADAFATAQLVLVLLAQAKRQRVRTAEELLRMAGARRWLGAG